MQKVSHFAAFQSSSLVNSYHVTPCDQRQIDMSQHDLMAELKEHTFKTAALQESGVDCVFLHFRGIIHFYVLNLTFFKEATEHDVISRPLQPGILHAQRLDL